MGNALTLITGITGLLGTALAEENRFKRLLIGVYKGNYGVSNTSSLRYVVCDIAQKEVFLSSFENDDIACIIHAASLADTDICEREPRQAYVSNVVGTENVIELARLKNAKLVFISSNAVFDGRKGLYNELESPNPINQYGRLKLECESLVKESVKDWLIVRPILMYGLNNPNERKSFFMWILDKLRNGESMNMVNDVFENPLLSYQCAEVIWGLIGKDVNGIYHVAGKDVLSRFEAAKLIAKVFSLDGSLINPVPSSFFETIAPRPKNTSYSTTKIESELGVAPLGFKEGLLILKKRLLEREGHTSLVTNNIYRG